MCWAWNLSSVYLSEGLLGGRARQNSPSHLSSPSMPFFFRCSPSGVCEQLTPVLSLCVQVRALIGPPLSACALHSIAARLSTRLFEFPQSRAEQEATCEATTHNSVPSMIRVDIFNKKTVFAVEDGEAARCGRNPRESRVKAKLIPPYASGRRKPRRPLSQEVWTILFQRRVSTAVYSSTVECSRVGTSHLYL